MIAAPDCCQYCPGHCLRFSRTANKAIITEVVEKDEIVTYNAHLELTLQVVGVSSPVFSFPCFTICQSPRDPLTGCTDLFHRFCPSGIPSERRSQGSGKETVYGKDIFSDMKNGLDYIWHQKEIFFLPLGGFQCQFFFAAFEFLLPFFESPLRGQRSLCDHLNLGGLSALSSEP